MDSSCKVSKTLKDLVGIKRKTYKEAFGNTLQEVTGSYGW